MKSRNLFRGAVVGPRAGKLDAPAATTDAARAASRVRVGREVSGRGGKGVTVITGLPLNATELDELATRLKKLCGAGGAVRNGNIEVQGEHRDRLVVELVKLGYSAKRSGG